MIPARASAEAGRPGWLARARRRRRRHSRLWHQAWRPARARSGFQEAGGGAFQPRLAVAAAPRAPSARPLAVPARRRPWGAGGGRGRWRRARGALCTCRAVQVAARALRPGRAPGGAGEAGRGARPHLASRRREAGVGEPGPCSSPGGDGASSAQRAPSRAAHSRRFCGARWVPLARRGEDGTLSRSGGASDRFDESMFKNEGAGDRPVLNPREPRPLAGFWRVRGGARGAPLGRRGALEIFLRGSLRFGAVSQVWGRPGGNGQPAAWGFEGLAGWPRAAGAEGGARAHEGRGDRGASG